jgi:predicted nucleic acid-binding protein
MKPLVIDASVAAKTFFPEEHSEECRKLLRSGVPLIAPDHLYAEVANVAAKQVRRFGLDPAVAIEAIGDLRSMRIRIEPAQGLVMMALDLALASGCSIYDALYVAAAIKHGCQLVTADARLHRMLDAGATAGMSRLIGNRPTGG